MYGNVIAHAQKVCQNSYYAKQGLTITAEMKHTKCKKKYKYINFKGSCAHKAPTLYINNKSVML